MDKILVVEDNMELSDTLCRNLQAEGFTPYAALSLAQARKYLDSGIDLCLLDINLPDGDGFAFCRSLSENTAIPVILLTVRDGAQDMVQGLSIGADDYVTKPFRMDVLVSRIRALLRRVRNRRPEDGSLYCGWTNRLAERIKAHNEGKGAKYTRCRRPVELVYYEEFFTKEEAMSREYAIKRLSRRQKLNLIAGFEREEGHS